MQSVLKALAVSSVALLAFTAFAQAENPAPRAARTVTVKDCGPLTKVKFRHNNDGFTSSSATYVDVTNAFIGFNQGGTTAGCAILNTSFRIFNSAAGSVRIKALLDTATLGLSNEAIVWDGATVNGTSGGYTFIFNNVTPGIHKVRLQAQAGSAQSFTLQEVVMTLQYK